MDRPALLAGIAGEVLARAFRRRLRLAARPAPPRDRLRGARGGAAQEGGPRGAPGPARLRRVAAPRPATPPARRPGSRAHMASARARVPGRRRRPGDRGALRARQVGARDRRLLDRRRRPGAAGGRAPALLRWRDPGDQRRPARDREEPAAARRRARAPAGGRRSLAPGRLRRGRDARRRSRIASTSSAWRSAPSCSATFPSARASYPSTERVTRCSTYPGRRAFPR